MGKLLEPNPKSQPNSSKVKLQDYRIEHDKRHWNLVDRLCLLALKMIEQKGFQVLQDSDDTLPSLPLSRNRRATFDFPNLEVDSTDDPSLSTSTLCQWLSLSQLNWRWESWQICASDHKPMAFEEATSSSSSNPTQQIYLDLHRSRYQVRFQLKWVKFALDSIFFFNSGHSHYSHYSHYEDWQHCKPYDTTIHYSRVHRSRSRNRSWTNSNC